MKKNIDIDIEVYKCIETARIDFEESQNDILRRLLEIDVIEEKEKRVELNLTSSLSNIVMSISPQVKEPSDEIQNYQKLLLKRSFKNIRIESHRDWIYNGVRLSEGTLLQKWYQGKKYEAVIQNGAIYFDGQSYQSPSTAAMAIAKGTNVNGWNFWEYFDKNNGQWQKIGELRTSNNENNT